MRKIDLAREYRTRYGMEMPTAKLSRIMYNQNNLLFANVDDARKSLRDIEGKGGSPIAKKDKDLFSCEERPRNPYKLPESDAKDFKFYFMPYYDRVGIINDIHFPFHSMAALMAAIDFLKDRAINALFLNGDIVDIHRLSHFERDPKAKRFSEELDILKNALEVFQETFKCPIYYKFGNHEERYDKFLLEKAHELAGVDEFDLENIIKKRFDCEIIKDKRPVIINTLPFIHGHEYGRGVFSPVNAARGLFNQAKDCAVKGDCHTTSEHTEPTIKGKIITTYSVGCLCHLNPKWLPLNKWNHGAAVMENKSEGHYRLDNRRIIDGVTI